MAATLKEEDLLIVRKDADGNPVIRMPITRVENVEGGVASVNNTKPDDKGNINLIDLVYPVGSIYMSASAASPATLFGGTWKALDEGRVLIGANDSYTAGSTGGEATHTLTTNEMPSHTHSASSDSQGWHQHSVSVTSSGSVSIPIYRNMTEDDTDYYGVPTRVAGQWRNGSTSSSGTYSASVSTSGSATTGGNGTHSHNITVANSGGGQAHNNMQPYLAVYMWERTA